MINPFGCMIFKEWMLVYNRLGNLNHSKGIKFECRASALYFSSIFVCHGICQAKIYYRDGLNLGEFAKGDVYIRDLQNTKGHIFGLTCGEWHPTTKETILTSSEDGPLRIWDVNNFTTQNQVLKPKLARPGRVPVTTCLES